MKTKKLQNNYTTPEQSKRLLELGVPADSADCYHNTIAEKPYILSMPYSYSNWYDKDNPPLPCWSVGRLIEIISICGSFVRTNRFKIEDVAYFYRETKKSVVDLAIDDIEILVNSDDMDFSKLED